MRTRELIEAEMEHLDDEQLEQLYKVVRELSKSKKARSSPSLMEKLKEIKIDGPEDFSTSFRRSHEMDVKSEN